MASDTLDGKVRINIQWIRYGGRYPGGDVPRYDLEVLHSRGKKEYKSRYEPQVTEVRLLEKIKDELSVAHEAHLDVEVAYYFPEYAKTKFENLSVHVLAIAGLAADVVAQNCRYYEENVVVQYWRY